MSDLKKDISPSTVFKNWISEAVASWPLDVDAGVSETVISGRRGENDGEGARLGRWQELSPLCLGEVAV
jgi:hypothetical protein